MKVPLGATRHIVPASGSESISVRCARLRVIRGPDRDTALDFGERRSAIIGTAPESDLVLSDDSVSFHHAELRAEEQGYVLRDLGSTNGTRVDGILIREVVLDGKASTISLGETDLLLAASTEEIQHPLSAAGRFGGVLGGSEAMRQMFAVLERAADGDSTILLEGESGTGKEAIAESVHALSPRARHPFQVVDCGSIPPTLIESELFGVQAGAFTGASHDRAGAIEEASSGTLFLDEIGELPLEMQPKLLRALERRQVKRVGAAKYTDVDFRVIAATNRDLGKLVQEGKFRADLYYRLAVVSVKVPPLRHRRDDIPLLAQHFAATLRGSIDAAGAGHPQGVLTHSLLAAFAAYNWPGNVRELRNAVERLIALGDLAPPPSSSRDPAGGAGPRDYQSARRTAIEEFERTYCQILLDSTDGVVSRAAERSGISRQMFHRLLRKHGIETD